METTTTAQNIQRLQNRLKVLTDQYAAGKLSDEAFERMLFGAFAELDGDS